MALTEKEREQKKNNREYLKKVHRCVDCLKIDSNTLAGKIRCVECAAKKNKHYNEKCSIKEAKKKKETRAIRKAEHRCTVCGAQLEDGYKYLTCESCRERRKKDYHFLKDRNICVKCKRETALDGLTMCYECSLKDSARQRKNRTENLEIERQKANEYQRNKRKNRQNQKKCTVCGKTLKDERYKTCLECRIKDRRRKKEKYNAKRYSDLGLCIWCGKETAEGTKYCKEHLQYMRELSEKNFRPNGFNISNNSYFRSLNNADFKKGKTTEVERAN